MDGGIYREEMKRSFIRIGILFLITVLVACGSQDDKKAKFFKKGQAGFLMLAGLISGLALYTLQTKGLALIAWLVIIFVYQIWRKRTGWLLLINILGGFCLILAAGIFLWGWSPETDAPDRTRRRRPSRRR